ncbi:hypothetical protein GCM10027399_27620 [Curvibacter fontanus]
MEFVADEEGDWAFHCHKSHHTMIGVGHRGLVQKMHKLVPDCMVMSEMGIPLPENPLPMMKGSITVRTH